VGDCHFLTQTKPIFKGHAHPQNPKTLQPLARGLPLPQDESKLEEGVVGDEPPPVLGPSSLWPAACRCPKTNPSSKKA
jgi:hypothetical protein